MTKFYEILNDDKKYGVMHLPEEIEAFYTEKGWKKILFLYVGDGCNDPRGQRMIWITNQMYDPDSSNNKKGYLYLSTRQSKEVQFYIDDEPIYYRIRSSGTFS